MHTYIHTHARTHARPDARPHARPHARTHAHIYLHTHIHMKIYTYSKTVTYHRLYIKVICENQLLGTFINVKKPKTMIFFVCLLHTFTMQVVKLIKCSQINKSL